MDPHLKALCLGVLDGDVNSESFANLIVETGVALEDFEFCVATKLLGTQDAMEYLSQKYGQTLQ